MIFPSLLRNKTKKNVPKFSCDGVGSRLQFQLIASISQGVPMRLEVGFRLGVILLLITSGFLKLVSSSPSGSLLYLSPLGPELHFVMILWEFFLAVWLLIGSSLRTAWLATIATFGVFLFASATLAVQGITNCGCLGDVPMNPWTMVVIDATIVALALPCFAHVPPGNTNADHSWLFSVISSTFVTCLIFTFCVWVGFGSLHVFRSWISGQSVYIKQPILQLRQQPSGKIVEVQLTIQNRGSKAISILHLPDTCSCIAQERLPILIPSGQSHQTTLLYLVPGKRAGPLCQSLQSNDDSQG
jgi:hypothetical protein